MSTIQNKILIQYNSPVMSFNNQLKKPKQTLFDAQTNTTEPDLPSIKLKKYIKLLQAIYCDEWVAIYQYSIENDFLNKLNFDKKLSDKAYRQISEELLVHSTEEFNHAKLIVPELIRIGSEPVYQMDMLQLTSNGQLLIPETNQTEVLNQAITAEEGAIKAYTELIKFINDSKEDKIGSPKFLDTVKYILDQEHEHKSDLERLLKEFREG